MTKKPKKKKKNSYLEEVNSKVQMINVRRLKASEGLLEGHIGDLEGKQAYVSFPWGTDMQGLLPNAH